MLRGLSSFVSQWGSSVLRWLGNLNKVAPPIDEEREEPACALPAMIHLPQLARVAHRIHKAVVWRRALALGTYFESKQTAYGP